jgi:hypothetical protein|tara:strand:- start:157 stop:384 length:228 start_codon:yes stop_codon:yes gene_type:complete
MPKKQVNESLKDKVMSALFRVLAKGDERKALKTALGKNPAIARDIKSIAKTQRELEKKLLSMPDGEELMKKWRNL